MNPDVGEKVVKRQLFPDLNTLCFCLLEQLTQKNTRSEAVGDGGKFQSITFYRMFSNALFIYLFC